MCLDFQNIPRLLYLVDTMYRRNYNNLTNLLMVFAKNTNNNITRTENMTVFMPDRPDS